MKLHFNDVQNQIFSPEKSALGEVAILTNVGAIMQNGAINSNGFKYHQDSHLPREYKDEHSVLRQFKELFIPKMNNLSSLEGFEDSLLTDLATKKSDYAWKNINRRLTQTEGGKIFSSIHKGFRIYAIVCMRKGCYGISINEGINKYNIPEAKLYCDSRSLILHPFNKDNFIIMV